MPHAIWSHWLRLTRTHRVVIALAEAAIKRRDLVENFEFEGPKFQISQAQFESSLADMELISRMVLQYSWEIFEDHCKTIIESLITNKIITDWKLEYYGCTEKWLDVLLDARGHKWEGRLNKAQIIEAATLRNALAHNQSTVTQSMIERLAANSALNGWTLGMPIKISVEKCINLRSSLQAYARIIEGTPPKPQKTEYRKPRKNKKSVEKIWQK